MRELIGFRCTNIKHVVFNITERESVDNGIMGVSITMGKRNVCVCDDVIPICRASFVE